MKLSVNNDWENYVWALDGTPTNLREIKTVAIGGRSYPAKSVKKRNRVSDHGHIYFTETYDIRIGIEFEGITTWVSLYENPEVLAKVTSVVK